MSDLISGKEALIALANGDDVLIRYETWDNFDDLTTDFSLKVFFSDGYEFKLKPRTITINGIEVPAPFKPKIGEFYYCVSTFDASGYAKYRKDDNYGYGYDQFGAWRTEDEIKQVVEALRSIFK